MWNRSLLRLASAVLCAGIVLLSTPPVEANPFGWHEHDGFYLRLSLGPAWLNIERDTEHEGAGESDLFLGDHSSISGPGVALELSIGATPFESFVIAGTILSHRRPEAKLKLVDGSEVPLDTTVDVTIVAPTIDVFPNEDGGLHFGGGVGLLVVDATVPLTPGGLGGVGGAATVHGGYAWWFADDWSVGAQLRATLGHVRGSWSDDGYTGREKDLVTILGLSATVLYH